MIVGSYNRMWYAHLQTIVLVLSPIRRSTAVVECSSLHLILLTLLTFCFNVLLTEGSTVHCDHVILSYTSVECAGLYVSSRVPAGRRGIP